MPFSWRSLFERSTTATFVVAGNRRVRYANPAWERATGASATALRGMKLPLRQSPNTLGGTLAPPPEVWTGQSSQVRRPAPGAASGPPWWDLQFLPLLGDGQTPDRVLGIIGILHVVAAPPEPHRPIPASLATAQAHLAGLDSIDAQDGPSPASQRLVSQIRAAAACDAPLWILGEPGSGKETVARTIHWASALRSGLPVTIDCRGLEPYLIEGFLFGPGGLVMGSPVATVILKQPETLPRDLQRKVLNWCESRSAPRFISLATATSESLVATGSLLGEFQTRMSALEIRVPPLRDRLDDLPRIWHRFHCGELQPEVLALLKLHSWPGNWRELKRVLSEAVVAANGHPLKPEHLPRYFRERQLIATQARPAEKPLNLDAILEAVERRMIQLALAQKRGNRTEAAALLGMFRSRLGRRIEALGLGESASADTE
jgi:transcriptional regulator of acetoin/glycerol metabolism